jgi:hypothetical protein
LGIGLVYHEPPYSRSGTGISFPTLMHGLTVIPAPPAW